MNAAALVDAIGTTHRAIADGETPRIVSLVPSVTELICELGLAHWLVGRTGFCIHPADVLAPIAKVGGTKDVNLGKLRKLQPTHVVVNIDENEKPTVDQIAEFVPNIIVTHPVAPEDNLPLYRLLGGIFGADARAEASHYLRWRADAFGGTGPELPDLIDFERGIGLRLGRQLLALAWTTARKHEANALWALALLGIVEQATGRRPWPCTRTIAK